MMADVHSLTGPYVLDALPGDERAAFEAHLADCAACRAEVAELTSAAARLGDAVAEPPPSRLKANVMSAVANTRQLPPRTEPAGAAPRFSRRNLLALAAGTVIVAAAGAVAFDQHREAAESREATEQLLSLLAEPDARTVRGPVTGGGTATVVLSRRRDAAVVVLGDVPAAPEGKVYQLWFIDAARHARSVGLLGREPGRVATTRLTGLAGAALFGVTIEPDGGSPQPTTAPIAAVAMA